MAQGWLALELSNSAFLVGVVASAGSLPVLALSLYAGVLADRVEKLRLVKIGQIAFCLQACALWWFTWSHHITIAWLLILATINGVINAFEIPARQSFVVELVGREDLPGAIALNSSGFNIARVVGPSIGGALIAEPRPGVVLRRQRGELLRGAGRPDADPPSRVDAPATRRVAVRGHPRGRAVHARHSVHRGAHEVRDRLLDPGRPVSHVDAGRRARPPRAHRGRIRCDAGVRRRRRRVGGALAGRDRRPLQSHAVARDHGVRLLRTPHRVRAWCAPPVPRTRFSSASDSR